MGAKLLLKIYLDQILAKSEIPGMRIGEEGGKNLILVINRLSNPEHFKQLWMVSDGHQSQYGRAPQQQVKCVVEEKGGS